MKIQRKQIDLSKLQIKKRVKKVLQGKTVEQCTAHKTCYVGDWQTACENYKIVNRKNQGLIGKTVSWFLIDGIRVEELTPWHLQVAGIKEGNMKENMNNIDLIDLESIMKKMVANDPSVIDNHGQWRTDLPVSGPEPLNLEKPVWSWNHKQALVGFSADDLEIIDR